MEETRGIQKLIDLIELKKSRICAGVDPKWEDMPNFIRTAAQNPRADRPKIFKKYCKQYIDAIADVVPAVKLNSAFFEKEGYEWMFFELADYASSKGLYVIGDVKRADSYASASYAEAYLGEYSPFDAVTVNPYFGSDGVIPFLELAKTNNKAVFITVRTSNESAGEIQNLELKDGRKLYMEVAEYVRQWAMDYDKENFNDYPLVGAVVAHTTAEDAIDLETILGKTFVLIPGYDDGMTASDVAINFDKEGLGAIINCSRRLMNAYKENTDYSEEQWQDAAKEEAISLTIELNNAINELHNDQIC